MTPYLHSSPAEECSVPPEPSFEQTDKEKVDTFKATMFSASTVYVHYDAPKPRPKPPARRKRELDFCDNPTQHPTELQLNPIQSNFDPRLGLQGNWFETTHHPPQELLSNF